MKCFWRILLGVLTAGLSEVLRHKSHDKTQICPEPMHMYVAVGTLNEGDFCKFGGLNFQIVSKGELVRLRDVVSGMNYDVPHEINVVKL